jgi:hypothetical protein
MRTTLVAVAWIVLGGLAQAETPACRSIPRAPERLACYDAAYPPAKIPESQVKEGTMQKVKDVAIEEEEKLKKKLQGICSHC